MDLSEHWCNVILTFVLNMDNDQGIEDQKEYFYVGMEWPNPDVCGSNLNAFGPMLANEPDAHENVSGGLGSPNLEKAKAS